MQEEGRSFVRVIWGEDAAARERLVRPTGSMRLADLATATGARRGPRSRPFLDLLRACLELRFATEVGLADTRPAAGGDDDVGIAANERPA
jgi:hypothetical protein